jgi:predicted transcriptional regulator
MKGTTTKGANMNTDTMNQMADDLDDLKNVLTDQVLAMMDAGATREEASVEAALWVFRNYPSVAAALVADVTLELGMDS